MILLVERDVVLRCDHFVDLLASWKHTSSEAKTVVGKRAQVLDFLILAVLEHVEHVLTLLELMLHLFCFQIFTLQDTSFKV